VSRDLTFRWPVQDHPGGIHRRHAACLLVIDLHNGDIVQWFRFRGDVTELFDVGVIPNIRCPRGIGPYAPGLEEAMRGEELVSKTESS
jgi:hypothetical protein